MISGGFGLRFFVAKKKVRARKYEMHPARFVDDRH